ncbi:MAG: STAS domain-containing protein [Phycisphaerae bacterium]|nr:STAS domain-containing protein [Phycisphaerae bacterium]
MAASPQSSNLTIELATHGSLRVVRLLGEIDLGSSPRLRQQFLALVEDKDPKYIVDLSGVPYMDSSGVGTLVEFKRKLERRRGQVVLVGIQPRVRSLFEITKLDKFFVITATLDEAAAQ